MRLWSLHPKYLDPKGMVAVWREGLLAKSVLEGKTKGYTKHPQLIRFKNHPFPLMAINSYLSQVLIEAKKRGYKFDENKISKTDKHVEKIKINSGQIEYEFTHLKNKLKKRSPKLYAKIVTLKQIQPHPLFKTVKGEIETWEIV